MYDHCLVENIGGGSAQLLTAYHGVDDSGH
jgi:hypothetical protein